MSKKAPREAFHRPVFEGSLASPKIISRHAFNVPDEEDLKVFEQIQQEIEQKIEGKLGKNADKKSTIELAQFLKKELDKRTQELKDSMELDTYHVKQIKQLKEENERLLNTVELVDGLEYLEAQERLVKKTQEIEMQIEALQQSFLKVQGIYKARLGNIRRKMAKEEAKHRPDSATRMGRRPMKRPQKPNI